MTREQADIISGLADDLDITVVDFLPTYSSVADPAAKTIAIVVCGGARAAWLLIGYWMGKFPMACLHEMNVDRVGDDAIVY